MPDSWVAVGALITAPRQKRGYPHSKAEGMEGGTVPLSGESMVALSSTDSEEGCGGHVGRLEQSKPLRT